MPRIRVQSCAPLSPLKAWFLVPDNVTYIRDLKHTLCSQLSILKGLQPAQLALEMDDFEVLDESTVDLVREADIVMLKQRGVVKKEGQDLKRKFDTEDPVMAEAKRRKLSKKSVSSSSSSSSSSDSDSDSSSSSSSSSSDSDSDTSSSSDSAPSVAPTKQKQALSKAIAPPIVPSPNGRALLPVQKQQPSVPPGYGKPSTQSRNKRRKIKRMFDSGKDKLAAPSTPTPNLEHTDVVEDTPIDLPYDDPFPDSMRMNIAPQDAATPPVALSGLGNSNKRKGFKKSMEGILPQKFVFDSKPAPMPTPFIPPSERETLPSNMFVTSVDVEWRTGQSRWQDSEEVVETLIAEIQPPKIVEQHGPVDWTAVGTGWSKYPRIDAATKLLPGNVVAWKGFGLDPVTLTPQAELLHLGKVILLETETLTVSPLVRGPVTFGRAQIIEEEGNELAEHVLTPLSEIWSADWRVVSTQ